MRRRFLSDSYPIEKERRLRRIKRRAHPELVRAYEHDELSLRKFDILSRLPIRRQKCIIATQKARIASALVAAKTIDQLLDSLEAGTRSRSGN